ncbi:MAG TPA: RHS repeat-associated core domain-containing protein [Pyrinomonadaceae bacterium]|nr:RHS repeat-associated core domain-containing protein [Pyrinomonadaceae bacterium]HMP67008.1 RHS repeat-associated core domain-containing protein [Pyrinomonadaceae bacterium]
MFTFDRYGNRNFDEANTTTLPKDCTESGNPVVCEAIRPIVNPSVNTANNRLNGYAFDPAGNTTVDAEGRQFTYDAENKQVKVKDSQNQTIGEYFYDGNGLRIKKFVPLTSDSTVYVYDIDGKVIAEYSTQLSHTPQVSYLTHDHLGSPRILTDENGNTISRRDFRPYGEEIIRAGYGQDSVQEKFATYERDEETNLDFAQERMYGNSHGRFTSPDPTLLSVNGFNPQSWNRYVYVLNNPLKFSDPLGLWEIEYEVIYKKNKDGTDRLDKKGRQIVDYVIVTARKSKEGDNAASLAKQLGLTGKDAERFISKVGDGDNIRLSGTGGLVGRVFGAVEDGLARQEQFKIENPNAPDTQGPTGDDCSETACRVGYPGALPPNMPGVEFDVQSADALIQQRGSRSIQEGELRVGDIVRWAKDKSPTHFANFIFRNDNGEPTVFSKSGAKGPFEIRPINGPGSITTRYGSVYGTVQGIGKKDTGYYRP